MWCFAGHDTYFALGSSHRLKPRRIIPGQKIHASVLYANAYKPQATLGEGFEIPIIHTELDDAELDSQYWESVHFDDTAALELVTHLGSRRGVAPIYLDRLLFMLRCSKFLYLFNSLAIIPSTSSEEGKRCVEHVHNWQDQFMNVIHNRNSAPLARLVTIVAYYETCESLIIKTSSCRM